jgi:hypothetical protein
LSRRHLPKPSLAKVSTVVESPRPPPSFPPTPGRRRPLEAAARPPDRGVPRGCPPLSLSTRKEEDEGGAILPKPPCFPPFFPQNRALFPLSLYSFQLAPELITNYELNTATP